MHIRTNSTLLIIGSLLFAHIGFSLPVAQVSYQSMAIPKESKVNPSQIVFPGKSQTHFIDDMNGKDVPPCIEGGRVVWTSVLLHNQFFLWRFGLQLIFLVAVHLWISYSKRLNMGKFKFLLWALIIVGIEIAIIVFVFPSAVKLSCDIPALSLFRITAFAPNFWSALSIFVGICLAYLANRFTAKAQRNQIPVEAKENP